MTKSKVRIETGLWLIVADGARFIIWSEPYMIYESVAVAKWRRLTKKLLKRGAKITSSCLIMCPVDNCGFASELLMGDELVEIQRDWRIVGETQETPTSLLDLNTVCPMCSKHARRFRKPLFERVLRIEERLDELEREELEES